MTVNENGNVNGFDNQRRLDPLAANGFGEGKVELYDASRPKYDPKILSHTRSLVQKQNGINVVEIAAGSGLFTRALLAHPDWDSSLAALRAIEPGEAMRKLFSKNVHDSRVTLSVGTFDDTGVEDGFADIVVIAAAFHWCLNFDAAMAEFARILKPGGVLTVLWYDGDVETSPLVSKVFGLERTYDYRVQSLSDPHPLTHWQTEAFITPSFLSNFNPQVTDTVRTTPYQTIESLINYILTLSYMAILPEHEKEAVKDKLRAIVNESARNGELVWKDQDAGVFEYPLKTHIVSAKRK